MKLLIIILFLLPSAIAPFAAAAEVSTVPMPTVPTSKLLLEDVGAIPFATDSAELGDKALTKIKQFGRLFSEPRMKSTTITIQGHAGATETDPKELSLKRAQAVAERLKQNFDLRVAQIQVVGSGSSMAFSTNGDNQRVVILSSKK